MNQIINNNQNNVFGPNNLNIINNQINKTPRKLDDRAKNLLLQKLPKNIIIDIASVLGDQEAYQFAVEIQQFLKNQGYNIDEVAQCVYGEPVTGQIIEEGENIYKIIIGSKE